MSTDLEHAAHVRSMFSQADLALRDVAALGDVTQIFLLGSRRDPRIAMHCVQRAIDRLLLASDELNKALTLVIERQRGS